MNENKYDFVNRGVTASPEDLSPQEDNRYEYTKHSISGVKKDLEAVIDLMGPETPQFRSSYEEPELESFSFSDKIMDECKVPKLAPHAQKYVEQTKIDSDESWNKTTCTETLPVDEAPSAIAEPATTGTECSTCNQPCPHPSYWNGHEFRCSCPENSATYNRRHYHRGIAKNHTPRFVARYGNKRRNIVQWLRRFVGANHSEASTNDYYKINVKESTIHRSPPKKLVFELVDRTLKQNRENILLNCNNPKCRKEAPPDRHKRMKNKTNENLIIREMYGDEQLSNVKKLRETISVLNKNVHHEPFPKKATLLDCDGTTRVDVYYFDHGDTQYLQTVDRSPLASTELLAERTENYTTKFWAEMFGTLHIGFSFCTSFCLQFCRFITVSLIRPLTVGLMQVSSDYLLKPLLATVFNAVLQPPLIFLKNLAVSFRDFVRPLAESIGFFLREIATVFSAFRFVEVKQTRFGDTQDSTEWTRKRSNSR